MKIFAIPFCGYDMPFSTQHIRAKNKDAKRKRRAEKPCFCNVCKGKRCLTSAVIKRHEESFGRLEDPDSDHDELENECQTSFSVKRVKSNDPLYQTSLIDDTSIDASQGSYSSMSNDNELQPIQSHNLECD